MAYKLSEIIAALGGELHGADLTVERLAALDAANANELSFVAQAKYKKQIATSQAAALIIPADMLNLLDGRSAIVCDDPYLYFARTLAWFNPSKKNVAGTHSSAKIGEECQIGADTEIGAHVCIGNNVIIGARCRVFAGVVIGDDCVLGDDVLLYPNVTLYAQTVIGSRVTVHAGAVIGADGFGLAWDKDHWFKIAQIGRVVLADDVEIGANSTIDRGALGDTVIAEGAKIDNLVHIAHNVQIGCHTAIAGCTAIAGSSKIGAYCIIGGAAMFVGHIEVCDHTQIGGGTLVSHSIREAGHYASSFPLSKHRDWTRNAVHIRHLDQVVKRIKTLEAQIKELNLSTKDKQP